MEGGGIIDCIANKYGPFHASLISLPAVECRSHVHATIKVALLIVNLYIYMRGGGGGAGGGCQPIAISGQSMLNTRASVCV